MSGFIPVEQFSRREWLAGRDRLQDGINYACGLNAIDGWINTDYFDGSLLWHFRETGIPVKFANGVYNLDLLKRHPFPGNSFWYAYCEDFIEHIDQKSSLIFLSEVYRTLKPGGVFRISTPSLVGVLERHFRDADLDKVLDQAGPAFDQWGHVHFYSHDSLRAVAAALRFVDYRICEFGVSEHEALQGRETRHEQIGLNLYAEMKKPN
jgi:SAM-dependent methyltransferase